MADPAPKPPQQIPALSADEQERTRALAAAYDYIRALVAQWDAEDRERESPLRREDQAS